MHAMIEFEVFKDGVDAGAFLYGADYDGVLGKLDEVIERFKAVDITPAVYLKRLKALVERHPDFIDGHAHIGNALLADGKPKLALQAYLCGLGVGERAIPAGFSGVIEWIVLENRPFLRVAQGAALCHLTLGQNHKALRLMERILAWNPNDNQGVRYLIGAGYLRAGELENAERIFTDNAESYPPYYYEHALLRLKAKDPVSAATSLRRGFVANGYIAEMLSGNSYPAPLAIWHASNFSEPETACDYLDHCGDLWRRTPGALQFVRWLHTHPKILTERAAVLECREELLWEPSPERRHELLHRADAARMRIDDALSMELVKKRTDIWGRSVEPWLYHPPLF